MSILIKNGKVVTASEISDADVFIEGDKISAIGINLNVKADHVIDAKDKLVMPGGIDPHVHLDMPFMGTSSSDDYTSGTSAALFGGTTMLIDFVLQTQGKSLDHALKEWQGRSNGKACCDYSFHREKHRESDIVYTFPQRLSDYVQQLYEHDCALLRRSYARYRLAHRNNTPCRQIVLTLLLL